MVGNINVPKVEKRKLRKSGSSIVLTIPKEWLEENDLEVGEEVIMIQNGDLKFKKINEENIRRIRNQLSHDTRTDNELKGRTPVMSK